MTHGYNAPDTGYTDAEQAAWRAGIEAGREIERNNAAASAEPIHQFRVRNCADWYDGLPDTSDGKDYETRTLYTAPVAAQAQPERCNNGCRCVTQCGDVYDYEGKQQPVIGADAEQAQPTPDWLRNAVLEEAAQACEGREQRSNREDLRATFRLCAKDIRALKTSVVNQSLITDHLADAGKMIEPLQYGHDKSDDYVTGWNDCVAALRSEQPVSGADGLPIESLLGCAGVSRLHGGIPAIFGTADIERFARCVLKHFSQPQPSGDAPLHPAVREAIEAAFEQREGWMTKIGAAVRHLPEKSQPSRNAGEMLDERAEFEWWASDAGTWLAAVERSGDGYKLAQTDLAWRVWQARAALAARAVGRE